MITPLLRQNDVATSFWRNDGVLLRRKSAGISINVNDFVHVYFRSCVHPYPLLYHVFNHELFTVMIHWYIAHMAPTPLLELNALLKVLSLLRCSAGIKCILLRLIFTKK